MNERMNKGEVKSRACVLYESTYGKCPEWANSLRQQGDWWLPKGGWCASQKGVAGVTGTGSEVSFWWDKNVLEFESGNGCTILGIH